MKPLEVDPQLAMSAAADELLVSVLDGYLADVEIGHAIEPESLFAQHPELAPRLRACLAGLQLLEQELPGRGHLSAPKVHLDGYDIIREAGRGGMGIVYEARETGTGRRVALKLLPFASTLDSRQLQRFQNEAHAAANLHHSHIVPVYDVCLNGSVHFYTMQFIDGMSLAEVVHRQRRRARVTRQAPPQAADETAVTAETTTDAAHALADLAWNTREYSVAIAQLVQQAASALDHAHQVGVIHRDIKPGNLLVDDEGHLWVTDFGLASVRGAAGVTATGDLLGTIRYMSPEQASAKRGVVDHRTDIYSLGASLYELLTLQAPFPGSDPQEVLAHMAQAEPRPPRRINQAIPRDLETIVLQAMAHVPEQRYATAQALAEDLRRFVAGQPIVAHPPNAAARIGRWAQRHRRWALAISLFMLIAVLGLAASTAIIYRALKSEAQQRALAESRALESRRHLYAAHMNLALEDWQQGNVARVLELLDREQPAAEQQDLRGFEWHHLRRLCEHASKGVLRGHAHPVLAVAMAADNSVWASADERGAIRVWNPATQALRLTLEAGAKVHGLAISRDGQKLAAACHDQALRVWGLPSGQLLTELSGHEAPVMATAFSVDGRYLAACSNNHVYLWDADSFESHAVLTGHDNQLNCLAVSRDGTMLASSGNDRQVVLWDLTAKEPTPTILGTHRVYVHCVAFSPDGQRLLSGSEDGMVQFWDVPSRRKLRSLRRHTGAVAAATFSPDGKHIASVSWDGSVKIWDSATDEVVLQQGHAGQAYCLAFAADGKSLLTGGEDRKVEVWNATARDEPRMLLGHKGLIRSIAFSRDGHRLISTGADHTVRLWDLNGREEPRIVGEHADWGMGAVFAHDDSRLITTDVQGNVRRWNIDDRGQPEAFESAGGQLWSIALTPDGKVLAGAGYISNTVTLWDAITGQKRRTLSGHVDRVWSVAISPDGKTLASGSNDRTIRLWDVAAGEQRGVIPIPASYVFTLAISPDGQTLAAAGDDHRVRLWDLPSRAEKSPLGQHPACVRCMAFFPDNRTLATGSDDGTVKLWDLATRQERATFRVPSSSVWAIAVAADGQSLAAGDSDGHITLWQAAPPAASSAFPAE